VNIITRILTNNWFAALVLIAAGGSLYVLHSKGLILETAIGGIILAIALILIIKGRKAKEDNPRN
jgi:hypothetical protein